MEKKKVEMVVSPTVSKSYNDCLVLIKKLEKKSKEEREIEYMKYQWMFSKSKRLITLETLFTKREDYREKFKLWFFVVCDWMFSPCHLGECNYNIFKEHFVRKETSDRFSQMVILSLGMMGYLTGIKSKYSHIDYSTGQKGKSHGTVFSVDMLKLQGWREGDMLDRVSFDIDCSWEEFKDWEIDRQMDAIKSIAVRPEKLNLSKEFCYGETTPSYELDTKEKMEKDRLWYQNKIVVSLGEHDTSRTEKCSTDDYGGRLYTIMTMVKKEIRKNDLLLDAEKLCEVDMSSAQPTFMGIVLKQLSPDTPSGWYDHCIKGDLYEWLGEVLDLHFDRKIIKGWNNKFLYSVELPNEMKEYKKIQKVYEQRLCKYLKENEPLLYNLICEHKKNPMTVKRKKPTKSGKTTKKRNELSREMVKMEVEYIKKCLSNIPKDIKIFTIHDCICCKESDVERVKSIMEQTSMDMFGVKVCLKIE